MKKYIIILILTLNFTLMGGIVPKYFGARALSLGYATTAFSYDINMLFINPSFLSSISYSMSGYQYQQSYQSYYNSYDLLNNILSYDISDFNSLSDIKKEQVWKSIGELYSNKVGLYGYKAQVPGFISKNYGISISFENESVVSPIDNEILSKDTSNVTQTDIDSLKFNFLGLSYKKFSIGYAMNFSQDLNIGVTLNYLSGKGNKFSDFLINKNNFNSDKKIDSYVSRAWTDTEHEFSKIIFDFAANMNIGQYFRVGAVLKNYGNPVISFADENIEIKQRIIAGVAFRPAKSMSLYIDLDIKKTNLLYNGEDMQPFSFGLEKGFFNNKLFIRAGFLSDLTADYFLGKKSNSIYGFGFGFNMNKIIVDCGMGIDNNGKITSIAVSGFVIVQ